jgi:peptidoglycan/LPS O-acetylase OafA/YrhL
MENKSGYIPYLDGCRALAISIVVFSHAGLGKIIPGKFGVTFFFFISGYLITRLLLAEMNEKGSIQFLPFYLRRLFRLYPALLVMIVCSAIAAYIMNCPLQTKDVFAALFYYTNYYIGWFRTPVEDCGRILDILWSLSVEEHFYLIFPLLIHLSLKKKQPESVPNFIKILVAFCAIGIAIRMGTYFYFDGDLQILPGRIYFSSHTRMDSIIWGCLASVLLFQQESTFYIKKIQNKWIIASALMALLLSVAIRNEFFRQTLLYSFQGYGLFILIPAIGLQNNTWIKNILASKWLIFIGKISYSLYLFHWIALKLSNHFFSEFSFTWQLFFWTLTILLSLGSYYGIEKPFVQLRKKFGSTI